MTFRSLFCIALAAGGIVNAASAERVLLISVDGMHALDLANYIESHPRSTLAQLAASGVNFTNASTTKPSDSFPSMVGIVTGGTPAVTGIYYDDAYNRKLSPPGSRCATIGTVIDLKEGIDKDPTAVDGGGGIDPAKLPLDPAKGCTPVYPHNLLRVNTVFEVLCAAGRHTAYSEKRPSYDILHGPSGKGVADLYTPEIAAGDTLRNNAKTQAFDELRVASVLHQINGKDHSGTMPAPVPSIFGMNFQSVNAAKKNGPESDLTVALDYVDGALGRMREALKARSLLSGSAIIVTSKHGETPLAPLRRQIVLSTVIPGIVNGVKPKLAARVTQKANALIWLSDQSETASVAAALTSPANQAAAGVGQVLSGASLKLLFPDPAHDPAVPDLIVISRPGINYEPSLGSKVLAEHGGFGENDTHVPLLVSISGIPPATVRVPVTTTQIAPTILRLLHLDPSLLEAVRLEKTAELPHF